MKFTKKVRIRLLEFTTWLHNKMQNHPDYSRNDPEWIVLDNEANLIKMKLKSEINK